MNDNLFMYSLPEKGVIAAAHLCHASCSELPTSRILLRGRGTLIFSWPGPFIGLQYFCLFSWI